MIQFHETGYGAQFFRGQLPALIHALQEISANLGKLVESQGKGAAVRPSTANDAHRGRQIMVLPSVDGEEHQGAVLTPAGMPQSEAFGIAMDLINRLHDADAANPDHDFNWNDLISALEVKGFMALPNFAGPTWDSRS